MGYEHAAMSHKRTLLAPHLALLLAGFMVCSCAPGENPSSKRPEGETKIPTQLGSDPGDRVSPTPAASDLPIEPDPIVNELPSPTPSTAPSVQPTARPSVRPSAVPSVAPSALPTQTPPSASGMTPECEKGIAEARAQYMKEVQLLRLRDKLDTLIKQLTPSDFKILMQSNVSIDQTRAVYIRASQKAQIDLQGSEDPSSQLKLSWTLMQEHPGVVAATFSFDDPSTSPEKLKAVFLGYFPGEKAYRVGYENHDGSPGRDLESLLAPTVEACAKVRVDPKSYSTLESTLNLPGSN